MRRLVEQGEDVDDDADVGRVLLRRCQRRAVDHLEAGAGQVGAKPLEVEPFALVAELFVVDRAVRVQVHPADQQIAMRAGLQSIGRQLVDEDQGCVRESERRLAVEIEKTAEDVVEIEEQR